MGNRDNVKRKQWFMKMHPDDNKDREHNLILVCGYRP